MGVPPPKIDPWEARERERARYARGAKGSRRSRSAPPEEETLGFLLEDSLNLRDNYLSFGLLLAVLLEVLGQVATFSGSLRTTFAGAGVLLLLLLLGTCRAFLDDMRVAIRRGPNPFILALLVWAGVCFFVTPYRATAIGEGLRVLAGVGAYFMAAYTLRSPKQTSVVIAGLLLIGVGVSVCDLLRIGQGGRMSESIDVRGYSVLGTHGNVGSLLVLMVPAALAFALNTAIEEKRRLAADAAALLLGGALLLSRTRSAWLAVVVSLVILTIFLLRSQQASQVRAHTRRGLAGWMESPVVMVALGFGVFAIAGGIGPLVSHRAASLLETGGMSTVLGRLEMWRGATLMSLERPLTGWGLGAFPLLQGQWTHAGDDTAAVLRSGPTQNNMAHNYYLQWTADTGMIGLALHVAVLTAFFFVLWSALRKARNGFQQSLLCGAGATVAGAVVDAIASPAYHFSGVSTLLWVWIGLGVAAMRPLSRREATEFETALGPAPWTLWTSVGACALASVLVVTASGQAIRMDGKSVARGSFEVVSTSFQPLRAGNSAEWQARFHDSEGNVLPTLPGTVWQVEMSPELARSTEIELDARLTNTQANDPKLSENIRGVKQVASRLRLLTRGTAPSGTIAIRAAYRDRWGRLYQATALKQVERR